MTLIARKPDPLIYLSSPYSHGEKEVRHYRYQMALLTVAHYLHEGIYLYSPILHNHPVACYRDLGTPEEWLRYDYTVLDRCEEMWVLRIAGWNVSNGVYAELDRCVLRGIKYQYIDPPVEQIPEGFCDFGGPDGR